MQVNGHLVGPDASDGLLQPDPLSVNRRSGGLLQLVGHVGGRDAAEQPSLLARLRRDPKRRRGQSRGERVGLGPLLGHTVLVGPAEPLGVLRATLRRRRSQAAWDEVVPREAILDLDEIARTPSLSTSRCTMTFITRCTGAGPSPGRS